MSDSVEDGPHEPPDLNEELREWQRRRERAADKDPEDREVLAEEVRKWKRMKVLAAQAEPSTEALVQRALGEDDPDTYWDCVMILHWRGSREVLNAARTLCADVNPTARSLGADILSQLGAGKHPFPVEAGDILLQMLDSETDPEVLRDIGVAFSNLDDERALEPLLRLQDHPHPEVRFGVARGLGSVEDPRSAAALIRLSRDTDADVREWATFGLGLQVTYDEQNATPAVRAALLARMTDEDDDTREEALLALAELHDEQAIAPLVAEMRSGAFTNRLLWAVREWGDPRFCAGLHEVRAWWPDTDEVERALAACGCASRNGHGQPAEVAL